jgi:hypothetical protein
VTYRGLRGEHHTAGSFSSAVLFSPPNPDEVFVFFRSRVFGGGFFGERLKSAGKETIRLGSPSKTAVRRDAPGLSGTVKVTYRM